MKKAEINQTTNGMAGIENTLTRIETVLAQVQKDVEEIKDDQKKNYATKVELLYIKERLEKMEQAQAKVVWLIISTVIIAVLYLVITVK